MKTSLIFAISAISLVATASSALAYAVPGADGLSKGGSAVLSKLIEEQPLSAQAEPGIAAETASLIAHLLIEQNK